MVVAYRTTWLCYVADTALMCSFDVISKGEESV